MMTPAGRRGNCRGFLQEDPAEAPTRIVVANGRKNVEGMSLQQRLTIFNCDNIIYDCFDPDEYAPAGL